MESQKIKNHFGNDYYSDVLNKIPHGYGNLDFHNDFYLWYDQHSYINYTGYFENGKPHGYGELRYYDDTIYIGNFEKGKRHGFRYMKFNYNEYYEKSASYNYERETNNNGYYNGNWENDKQHGNGVFTAKDGDKWEGVWKNGVRDEGVEES